MRFVYGFIAIILWVFLVGELCPDLSDEMTMLTCSIVAAGAMAGEL